MAIGVKRIFAIFISLSILLSLGAGSFAHAAEPIACAADVVVEGHNGAAPESSDNQAPDKAAQHVHGSCHGHHVATADDDANLARSLPPSSLHVLRDQALEPGAISNRDLRPPIA